MNTCIIVAAGTGSRFGGPAPKQFLELNEKPVLVHTIERFQNCDRIDRIVLVLAADEIERFGAVVERYRLGKVVRIVAGGETRNGSVRRGFGAVEAAGAAIVAVHDGARPLVTTDEIERTIEAAEKVGAACLVAEVTDTIKRVGNGRIEGTVDRRTLRRALTPQCFRYEILRRALERSDPSGAPTDESYLVELTGAPVVAVPGSALNIKITRPEDLAVARLFMNEMEKNG